MTLVLDKVTLNIKERSIVKGLSLQVDKGEVVGLLGPNGAGKTSTFNMIIGLLKPNNGCVLLDGSNIENLAINERARLGIGYLPQEPSIFRKLTVRENLDIALSQTSLSPSKLRSRREELIEEFNLVAFLNRTGSQLSGGERRRSEIARALAVGNMGPKYLLLDEPFAGIDPIAINDLQSLIYRLRKKGMGILITDHNVRETLETTDRAYILSNGNILFSGTSSKVAEDPIVKKTYLGTNFEL